MTNKSKRRGRSRQSGHTQTHPHEGQSLESTYFSSRRERRRRPGIDTKSLQLCRQVQRRLDLALSELDDPMLSGLWVQAVIPQSGGRSLIVELVCPSDASVREILARLDVVRGRLREEIAAAIHRKRTPFLQFMIVPPSDLPGGDPLDPEDLR